MYRYLNGVHVHVYTLAYTYLEVVGAEFLGAEHAEEGEEHDGKERSGGHRQSLRHPVHSHDGDRVGAATLLQKNTYRVLVRLN